MQNPSTIYIAAAALTRGDGAMLLVRKRGTSTFMQPGGKIEPHEDADQALCRELSEELGLTILPTDAQYVGRFAAQAANETDHVVIAEIFRLESDLTVEAAAEIEEARWVNPATAATLELAPLTRDHVLPLIRNHTR